MIKVKRKWSDAMAHSAHLLSECVENWSMPGHLWKYNQLWTMSIKIRKPSLALNLSKRMLKELSQLQKLIILPREEEGILTQTEFMFSKFCAEEKLKKKTSDHLLSMIKRRDFVIEDIRAETIRELETLIWDCSRNKISEYDLWTKADGKQEVKVYLRSLKLIIQDILADLGFAYKPPVSLVRIPRGERRTQIWTSQRSDLVENYCAPDRKGSCPGLHNYFQRRFVGENESLLWADPRWVGLFNFCKLQTVPNSSSQLMSCLCIGSDLAQHSRER